MNTIILTALSMEEVEYMLKVIDKWARHFYNVYGVERLDSWNIRANNGRAKISIRLDSDIWDYIKDGALTQVGHVLDKAMEWYLISENVYTFQTCESSMED